MTDLMKRFNLRDGKSPREGAEVRGRPATVHEADFSDSSSCESSIDTTKKPLLWHRLSKRAVSRRAAYRNRMLLVLFVFIIIGGTAAIIWLSLVTTLISRLELPGHSNGLESVVHLWKRPGDGLDTIKSTSPGELTRDINPIPCHSHNDYWRKVPLFAALAAGCTSVEADIWPQNNSEDLLVGHAKSALTSNRTLKSLYINPIMAILEHQNQGNESGHVGVFDVNANTSVVLLLDFKSTEPSLWSAVQTQIQPLREKGWLTYWDQDVGAKVTRPVTVVATGDAPFDTIANTTTHRDIFYDAPLDNLAAEYDISNSHYASVSMGKAIGSVIWSLRASQKSTLEKQIKAAADRGLLSRYWDTPSWPLVVRDGVWGKLEQMGVGVLNVDDLKTASRWNWRWCVVAGLVLC